MAFCKNQRIADTTITALQAVMYTTNGHVTPATPNLRGVPFEGIALSSARTGQAVYVDFNGLINPSIFNLGDGYACAVGVDTNGLPVRATDPNCASSPNWIGWCDAHGNVNIQPVLKPHFDVRD